MKKRTIIKNGRILTMDEQKTADWLVVEGEKILAVGSGTGYEAFVQDECRILDAMGGSVLPGFIDNHMHVVKTALAERYVDLSGVHSFEQLQEVLGHAAQTFKGKLLIARGLDINNLEEKAYPGRTVLDQCCNDKPLAIYSADYHVLMLNTYGIMYYKIPFSLLGLNVDAMGVPTGILEKHAGTYLDNKITLEFSYEEIDAAIDAIMSKLLSYGLTTVAAMEGGNLKSDFLRDYESEFMIDFVGKYPIAMHLFYQTTDADYIAERGLAQIGGSLYVDGTISSRTAALSFDYADREGHRGSVCLEPEHLDNLVRQCCELNLQLSLDVIGDYAIEQVLTSFEKADPLYHIKDRRFRIEHAELVSREQMQRAAALGVVLSMQPYYETLWGEPGGLYEERLGARYREANAFRSILDSGIVLCGGSDSVITPANPLEGIAAAVNHPIAEQRISVEEAVRMYTANGAYALFQEESIGSLTPGKDADLVILDRDICAVEPEEINTLRVVDTMKLGEVLFENGAI